MPRPDVQDGFVSGLILTEIETMSLPSDPPDPGHQAHFEGVLGPITGWRRLAPESEQARLWLGVNGRAPVGVLKLYRPPRGADRERRAYQEWAPSLAPWTAPFYDGPEDDPGAFVLGYVPGETATFAAPPAIFEAAGRFAAKLHHLPHRDKDVLPLSLALHRRLDAARRRDGAIDAAIYESVARLIEAGDFGGRVPCHRDFAPWNWRVFEGRLGVLDFGQARADTWLMDLVKLVVRWTPAQEEAFFSGYGRGLSEGEARALAALVGLHGLGSIQWGLRHALRRPTIEGERALIWFGSASRRYGLG